MEKSGRGSSKRRSLVLASLLYVLAVQPAAAIGPRTARKIGTEIAGVRESQQGRELYARGE
ncbi:MAG: hypothetical protein GDA48_24680 [Hormoscilla sp. GM102CHS1]|nr:hypothetical protein [Hormoscilla sp. GM102CHS1]